MLKIIQLPVLSDNYIYLLQDRDTHKTAVVDPAVAQPVLDTLSQLNWTLDFILNTHHHGDHVGGNVELKNQTDCKVVGAAADSHRIPGIDIAVMEDDYFKLGATTFKIMATPGHTSGHIVYYSIEDHALFCGDTLFAMGCGRLFEGTAEQMWQSLQRLRDLPGESRVYCAHEYTLANGKFALTIEPENSVLKERILEVQYLRAENRPTIPSTIELEKATNPFFRADQISVKEAVNLAGASAQAVFTEVRKRKNSF